MEFKKGKTCRVEGFDEWVVVDFGDVCVVEHVPSDEYYLLRCDAVVPFLESILQSASLRC